jgi:Kef-type K+ transport system membrane component KefB
MEILYVLLVLLLVTRVFGEIAARLSQPPLLGELLAGIALGAAVSTYADLFPLLAGLTEDKTFGALSNLGIFFLMLFAGIELRMGELAEVSGKSIVIGVSGLVVPVTAGFGLAWMVFPDSSLKLAQCLFVGTALAITAVPVSIRVLMDLGQLHSAAGRTIVSAAVIDDLLSLILLAFLTGLITSDTGLDFRGLALLVRDVAAFLGIAFFVGRSIVPRVRPFVRRWRTAEFAFTSLLLASLTFALLADWLGLHFIMGAFVAGLLFERRYAGRDNFEQVRQKVSAITVGFLAPIFFASIGLHIDASAVSEIPGFLVLLIAVAFFTKLAGAGVPAYLLGLSKRDAWAVGVGMSGRGAVELVIADIALHAGLFNQPDPAPPIIASLFSAIVIVAITTTVAAPLALRWIFGRPDRDP